MKWKLFVRDMSIIVGAVVVGGGAMYGVMRYQQSRNPSTAVLAAQQQSETTITDVEKLMVLPKEIPTVATVSDVSKLKGETFFMQAQNGDKVLIYTQAKEAILYRPSLNKLIEVSPLDITATATPQPTSSTASNAGPTVTPITQRSNPAVTFGLTSSPTPSK